MFAATEFIPLDAGEGGMVPDRSNSEDQVGHGDSAAANNTTADATSSSQSGAEAKATNSDNTTQDRWFRRAIRRIFFGGDNSVVSSQRPHGAPETSHHDGPLLEGMILDCQCALPKFILAFMLLLDIPPVTEQAGVVLGAEPASPSLAAAQAAVDKLPRLQMLDSDSESSNVTKSPELEEVKTSERTSAVAPDESLNSPRRSAHPF